MTDRAERSRRDRVAAAATAVVVLALVLAFMIARGDNEAARSSGSPSTARTGVADCGHGDLVAGRNRLETVAGTAYRTTTLELAPGVEPCSVDGYPSVIVLSDGRPAGVGTESDPGLGRARRLTVLPDRSAKVTLGWAVFGYCGPTVNDTIRLLIAPDLSLEIAGFGPTSCRPGDGRPPVRVGSFTYVDPTVEQGTVTGLVALNSGPALGTGEFATSGVVEFDGDPDSFVAPIGPAGGYEIELPAGRYRVTVSTRQWNAGAPYPAGVFEVVGGELNERNITLPVR